MLVARPTTLSGVFDALDELPDAHLLAGGTDLMVAEARLRFLAGARFDHDDAVHGAGDDEIEAALFALREGGIDDVLAIDQADSHGGDGLFERSDRAPKVA